MPKITALPETFKAASVTASEVGEHYAAHINGTVKVQYGNDEIDAHAMKFEDGSIGVLGFVGRYRTGVKAWRVSFQVRADGVQYMWFGNDDRSGRCQKNNGVSFDPAQFFKV